MSYVFFDTSALVKRYYPEEGTKTVDDIIEDSDVSVVITTLSVVAAASAFRRKYNRGEIDRGRVDALLASFFTEALEDFLLVPLDDVPLGDSLGLVLEDDLRTLDSTQLAAALSLAEEFPSLRFVCADRDLTDVGNESGLDTVVPS